VFNPNPAVTGTQEIVTTTGLIDNAIGQPLNGVSCSTTLYGLNYSQTLTGNVVNGTCTVTFPAGQTPTVAGTYQAITSVTGPNGTLTTAPKSVVFNAQVNILATTGGFGVMTAIALTAGLAVAGGSFVMRKRMIKAKEVI